MEEKGGVGGVCYVEQHPTSSGSVRQPCSAITRCGEMGCEIERRRQQAGSQEEEEEGGRL